MNMEQLLLAGSKGQDLKRQRGRQSTEEEGSKRSLARSLALPSVHKSYTHTPRMTRTNTDGTTYHTRSDATTWQQLTQLRLNHKKKYFKRKRN